MTALDELIAALTAIREKIELAATSADLRDIESMLVDIVPLNARAMMEVSKFLAAEV